MRIKLKLKLLGLISMIVLLLASIVPSAATFWFTYQPREPKSLRKIL